MTTTRIDYFQSSLTPLVSNGMPRLHRHLGYINLSQYNQMTQGGSAVALIATGAISGGLTGEKIGGGT